MFFATLNLKIALKSTPQPHSPVRILLGKESGYIFVGTSVAKEAATMVYITDLSVCQQSEGSWQHI